MNSAPDVPIKPLCRSCALTVCALMAGAINSTVVLLWQSWKVGLLAALIWSAIALAGYCLIRLTDDARDREAVFGD
jgi:hypothetical protein